MLEGSRTVQFAGIGAEVYRVTGSEKDSAVAELLRLASTRDKAVLQQLGKLREATALPAHLAALPDANGDMTLSIIDALGRINGCA